MSCISRQNVLDFLAGSLDPGALGDVEQHLDACDPCRRSVVELAGKTTMEGASPSPPKVGRYEILRPIGAGGMGVVYLALDPDLGRRVALKLLRPDLAGAPGEARARIQREARAMARVVHPSVVAIHDVGVHEDQVFVVMELVEGGTLREWLAREKPDWGVALHALLEAGRGLAAAHAAGLVHRDFKPDNVLVGIDGHVRVTDFGLARQAGGVDVLTPTPLAPLSGDPLSARLSVTGTVAGSPAYMAPEVARGEQADVRSDVFSFCVAACEALYGELPFAGDTIWQIAANASRGVVRPAPSTTAVPEGVRSVLLRGLSARREDRVPSVGELLEALEAAALELPKRGGVNAGGIERTRLAPARALKGAHVALVLLGIGVLAAVPYFLLRGGGRSHPETARPASIAVLPFVNLSGSQENEYFADGMTEEIINALANVEGVLVVARTSAFSFKGKNVDIRQIGDQLNVATVLEGSVRREGNQLRVVAQLVGTADGYHIWSKTYDREPKNVFSLEDELARAIVQALTPRLVPRAALVQQSTSSSEAHDLYLRGRFFWNQRAKESLTKAAALFEQAIALDARYALAYAGLADCHLFSMVFGSARAGEALPKAKALALKAVDLDDSLAEAHASLGLVHEREYDWSGAEREYRRAIELRPGYATAHQWYALLLRTLARSAEEHAEMERARQLVPTSVVINSTIAAMYYNDRDYERAILQATKTLELDPGSNLPVLPLVAAYKATGKYAQALATLDKAASTPWPTAGLWRAQVLAASGNRAAAQRLVAEYERSTADEPLRNGALAQVHLALGDKDGAFLWLDRAVEERNPVVFNLKAAPQWDPIRADPRYHKLLKRLNLE